jgi:hypothetical protein
MKSLLTNIESKTHRIKVLMAYYGATRELLLQIASLLPSDRVAPCRQHKIDRHILRTMLDYDRYRECRSINALLLKNGEDISKFRILDFGCLVSDYGIYFARLKADVTAYDERKIIQFVRFRFKSENLYVKGVAIPADYDELFKDKDLVVFGEVLEHLDNPSEPIQSCITQSVRYIFTSCYPFGDDAYFSLPGHRKSAQALQPHCIKMLLNHYNYIPIRKKAVLWRKL